MHSPHRRLTCVTRRAQPVHFRPRHGAWLPDDHPHILFAPPEVWLQVLPSCVEWPVRRLHPSIVLAAVAIGLLLAGVIASAAR